MIDHFIDWILGAIGHGARAATKERVKEQIVEVVIETTVDETIKASSPKEARQEAKLRENFQEFIASLAQDGLLVMAMVTLALTVFGGLCLLIADLLGERFFFQNGNIRYAAEFLLCLFAALFVPAAVVAKATPLFLKIPSRKARGWLAFALFVVLFGVVYWLVLDSFPGLSEVLAQHLG